MTPNEMRDARAIYTKMPKKLIIKRLLSLQQEQQNRQQINNDLHQQTRSLLDLRDEQTTTIAELHKQICLSEETNDALKVALIEIQYKYTQLMEKNNV